MILLIDNYDSFVYNLVRYVMELGCETSVKRNDDISIAEIEQLAPSHIIISPGPCSPSEAGISNDVIKNFAGRIPILGVCLGHQCIGQVFGGEVIRAPTPIHGKNSEISHNQETVFAGLPSPLSVTRYHSLVVNPYNLPDELVVTAKTEDGIIMGISHNRFQVHGVQFHPEAHLTQSGHKMIDNFLKLASA
jgi:anthranilate synthase/aminodeoxychorismate synthase-like glutamine amidotransferase